MEESNYIAKPFYFNNKKSRHFLFGVEYIPSKPKNIGIVFLQPIGTERNVIDAIQVNLARTLASSGITVLRFDYFGTGDSQGDFSQISLETFISDIDSAVDHMACNEYIEKTGLFGLRFGALLAIYYTENKKNQIQYLILCEPVVNASDYIKQELRQSISTQTVLFKKVIMDRNQIIQNLLDELPTTINGYDMANMNGFPLTKELVVSIKDIDLFKDNATYSNDCLILHIAKSKRKKSVQIEKLETHYCKARSIQYFEILEKTIPWIHGTYLMKTSDLINNTILEWIEELHGKNN